MTTGGVYTQMTIADIDGDTYPDILGTTNAGYVYAWDRNGTILSDFPKVMNGGSLSSVSVGNIDNDDNVEIVASTTDGSIFVWDCIFFKCALLLQHGEFYYTNTILTTNRTIIITR